MVTIYYPATGRQSSTSGTRRLTIIYDKLGIPFRLLPINAENVPYELFVTWCQYVDDLDEIINTGKRMQAFLKQEGINFEDLSLRGLYYAILRHPYILRDPISWNGKLLTAGIKETDAQCMLPRHARQRMFQTI